MTHKPKLRVICPTPNSKHIADTLEASGLFDLERWERPKTIAKGLAPSGRGDDPSILAVCAIGILMRLASVKPKGDGQCLLAATEDGSAIIPVLGGHEGANALANKIAEALGGQAIITTASDQTFALALDECPRDWALAAQHGIFSKFMQNLLEDQVADLSHAPVWVKDSAIPHQEGARLKITEGMPARYSYSDYPSTDTHLIYVPLNRLVVGLGCERGCPTSYVQDLIDQAQTTLGFEFERPHFASINLKANEEAFVRLAPHMTFFSADELAQIEVPNPSEVVAAEVGTPSVAEASALALAGPGGNLILPKIKNEKATLAVALADQPLTPNWHENGRARPHLDIIGLGPGAQAMLSDQAFDALGEADLWVGYSLYLDQAKDLTGQSTERLNFNLGDEEARCRAALDEAAKGKRVALICSGDPQIYAMAQVVYELLARHPENAAWQRTYVETLPGITAMQALAAKVGAPMGHDFCAISLSDLNTPWEVIEKKVKAAAEGDFVIGFYNPRSKKRDWQLPRSLEILREHRPLSCPVAFGRNVSRPDEAITRTTLGELNPEDIDMFTCLIVGASFTQRHRDFIFTPRGYKLS